jgi:hypothetical protein
MEVTGGRLVQLASGWFYQIIIPIERLGNNKKEERRFTYLMKGIDEFVDYGNKPGRCVCIRE